MMIQGVGGYGLCSAGWPVGVVVAPLSFCRSIGAFDDLIVAFLFNARYQLICLTVWYKK